MRRFSPFTRRNRSSTASTLPKIGDLEPSQVKGRSLAAEFEERGWFDTGGSRMSPAPAEDIAGLDVYGRSAGYRGPVRIIHGDKDDVAPLEYARRYLEHYDGNAELEVVAGADHAWATVPHRTRLHKSTAEFFRREL